MRRRSLCLELVTGVDEGREEAAGTGVQSFEGRDTDLKVPSSWRILSVVVNLGLGWTRGHLCTTEACHSST